MPIDPADIRAQEFRVTFRGYDIGEVDAFLDWIEEELGRPAGVRAPSGEAPGGSGADAAGPRAAAPAGLRAAAPAEEDGTPSVALRTLLHAERMAEQVLADATGDAAEIVARSRAEAEAILADARDEAAQIVAAASRAPRGAEVDDLVVRGRRLRAELDRIDESERRCRDELRTWLDEHDRLLDQPPHPGPGEAGDRPGRARADTTVRRVTTTLPFTAVR
ncbi:DivIVA domain-containing protein [Geodermatophilus sp. CPCC 206100]|uniref:DivIVA domain-containing protein n=1 Tax=Geodermatophilus sp. CPCC 206100 TaxID=3020054 RepID=UPI003AFFFC18